MGKIYKEGVQYGGTLKPSADNILFNNTSTGITATDVNSAIVEVNTKIANMATIYQEEAPTNAHEGQVWIG